MALRFWRRWATASEAEPPVHRVIVTAAERPEALRHLRLLAERVAPGDPSAMLLDDCVDQTVRAANRAAVAEMARQGRPVAYLGAEEKRTAIERILDRSVPDPELAQALEFAMFGLPGMARRVGANRNFGLLLSAGDALLCLDDDVQPILRTMGNPSGGLTLSSRDSTRATFYRSRGDALAALDQRPGEDLVGASRVLLGRSVAQIAKRTGAPINIDTASSALLAQWRAGSGRVRVVSPGSAGYSGMSMPLYFLLAEPQTRQQTWDAGEEALLSREILRAAPGLTISDNSHLMGLAALYDHSVLLPPFLPVLRGQDGLFGLMLRLMDPTALIAHLPQMVIHDPPGAHWAMTTEEALAHLPRVGLASVLSEWLLQQLPTAADPAERLRQMGQALADRAADSSLFSRALEDGRQRVLQRWQNAFASAARHTPSAHWAAALIRAGLDRLRLAQSETQPVLPFDCGNTPEQAATLARSVVQRYASLLRLWPRLFQLVSE